MPPESDDLNADTQAIFERFLDRGENGDGDSIEELCRKYPERALGLRVLYSLHRAGEAEPTDPAGECDDDEEELVELRRGDLLGPYKILDKLGTGGMGVVYLAEQSVPLRRRVAIKAIKLGMDTREVIARFEAERQALALMDHAGIARIFDAGATASGKPYFVMEYVQGVPLLEFCEKRRLTLRGRLELFLKICDAIRHAHERGILHRDIKPSNILVSAKGSEPVVKMIDFGVAKATSQRLTERTLYTQLGRVVGTPMYMSPEQAEMSGEEIDHRTDIYSLGVVLYELIVGVLPMDWTALRRSTFDAILRHIRDENPPTPSTRWTRLDQDLTQKLALQRSTTRSSFSRSLRGELDWIIMKALEKDPGRRYPTVAEFAADVERYLRRDPVLARPPSFFYLLGKRLHRHRGLVAGSCAAVVALVAGVLLAFWLIGRSSPDDTAFHRQVVFARQLLDNGRTQEARELLAGCPPEHRDTYWREVGHDVYRADFAAALAHVEQQQWEAADDGLDACLPDLSGFEWHRLRFFVDQQLAEASGALETSIYAHADYIFGIDLSPDGALLASGGMDRELRLFDARSGEPLGQLGAHDASISAVTFSPDGGRVASASDDRTVALYDVEERRRLASLPHDAEVSDVAFLADGRRLVTACDDQFVWLWDSVEERVLRKFEGHRSVVNAVAVTRDGLVASAGGGKLTGEDCAVRLWDLEGNLRATLRGHSQRVKSLDFNRDGNRLASAAADRGVRVWNTATRRSEQHRGHVNQVMAVVFSPDGRRVASAGLDRTVRLWEPDRDHSFIRLHGHEAAVYALAFSPDGRRLFSASADGVILVWETELESLLRMRGRR